MSHKRSWQTAASFQHVVRPMGRVGLILAAAAVFTAALALPAGATRTTPTEQKPTVEATIGGDGKGIGAPLLPLVTTPTATPTATPPDAVPTVPAETVPTQTPTPDATEVATEAATATDTPEPTPTPTPLAPETLALGGLEAPRLFTFDAGIVETWGGWGAVEAGSDSEPFRPIIAPEANLFLAVPAEQDTDLLLSLVGFDAGDSADGLRLRANGIDMPVFIDALSPTRADLVARIPRDVYIDQGGALRLTLLGAADGSVPGVGVSRFAMRTLSNWVGFDAQMPPDWTGWALTENVDGVTFQTMDEATTLINLGLPNTRAVDVTFVVLAASDSAAVAGLELRINGTRQTLIREPLTSGATLLRAVVPPDMLLDGLNAFEFTDETGSGLAFDWLNIGQAFSRTPLTARLERTPATAYEMTSESSFASSALFAPEMLGDASVQWTSQPTVSIPIERVQAGQPLDFEFQIAAVADRDSLDTLRILLNGLDIPAAVWPQGDGGRARVWGRIPGNIITGEPLSLQVGLAETTLVESRRVGLALDWFRTYAVADGLENDAWLQRSSLFPQIGFDGPMPADWTWWSAVETIGGRAVQRMTAPESTVRLLIPDARPVVIEAVVLDEGAIAGSLIDALTLTVNGTPIALNQRVHFDGTRLVWAIVPADVLSEGVDTLAFTTTAPGLAFDSLGTSYLLFIPE